MLEVRTEVLRLLPHLRRFCVALLGDRDSADELLAERLRSFLSRRDSVADGELRIALFRSVVESYCTAATSKRLVGIAVFPRRHRIALSAGDERAAPDAGLNGTALAQALRELDAEDRVVVLLKDLEDMTYEDAARVMGKSINNVKSRHYRAHHALRRIAAAVSERTVGHA